MNISCLSLCLPVKMYDVYAACLPVIKAFLEKEEAQKEEEALIAKAAKAAKAAARRSHRKSAVKDDISL